MKKERIIYLDIVKSVAIFLVCIYHFPLIGDISFSNHLTKMVITKRFLMGFCSAGVPLFFMSAGALYPREKIQIRKYTKLLFNYVLWRFLTLTTILIYNGIPLEADTVINLIMDTFLLTKRTGVSINHLWFIPCFVCVQILASFFIKPEDKKTKRSMGIILILLFLSNDVSVLVMSMTSSVKWDTNNLLTSFKIFKSIATNLFYFWWGNNLHLNRNKKNIPLQINIVMLLLGNILLFAEWYVRSEVAGVTWDNIFGGYSTAATLCMATGIWLLCIKWGTACEGSFMEKVFSLIGKNTITIYYLHWIFGSTIMWKIIRALGLNDCEGILLNMIKACFMVICFSVIGEIGVKIKVNVAQTLLKADE